MLNKKNRLVSKLFRNVPIITHERMSPFRIVVRCSVYPAGVVGRREAGAKRRPTGIPQPHSDTAARCACSGGSTLPSVPPPAPASVPAPSRPPSPSFVSVLSNSLLMSPCCGRLLPHPGPGGHSYRVTRGTFSWSSDTKKTDWFARPPRTTWERWRRAGQSEAQNRNTPARRQRSQRRTGVAPVSIFK
jgi:hypothetical protein